MALAAKMELIELLEQALREVKSVPSEMVVGRFDVGNYHATEPREEVTIQYTGYGQRQAYPFTYKVGQPLHVIKNKSGGLIGLPVYISYMGRDGWTDPPIERILAVPELEQVWIYARGMWHLSSGTIA